MGKCYARTKKLNRCKNYVEHGRLFFCREHYLWGLITVSAIATFVLTTLANLVTITGAPLITTKTPTPSQTPTLTPSPVPLPEANSLYYFSFSMHPTE